MIELGVAVATRIAGGLGTAVPNGHDVRAAEVEVQALEPVQALAPALKQLQLGRVDPALAVEPVAFDVDARVVDGLAGRHPVVEDVDRHLRDRRPQPVRQPLELITSSSSPPLVAIDGACMLVSRVPGGMWWPAARSSSPIMLFRWSPVPGTTTPEWDPFDAVNAQAFPARSTAETCVVPHPGRRRKHRRRLTREGRDHGRPARLDRFGSQHVAAEPSAVEEPGETRGTHPAGGAHGLGVGPQRARPARRERPGHALEHRQHVPDQGAARRRRRVRGDDVAAVRGGAAAVATPAGRPPDRPW